MKKTLAVLTLLSTMNAFAGQVIINASGGYSCKDASHTPPKYCGAGYGKVLGDECVCARSGMVERDPAPVKPEKLRIKR
jgi:hypothetical protein